LTTLDKNLHAFDHVLDKDMSSHAIRSSPKRSPFRPI